MKYRLLWAICALFALSGCDAINRHMILSTIFDGVPSLPSPEQLCADYADKRVAQAKEEQARQSQAAGKNGPQRSVHEPYEEKRCNDCHDKTKEGGLMRPKTELCFMCHTNFIQGTFVHGPVAVRDCLACHSPHDAPFPKLLKSDKSKICLACHRENRTTSSLHEKASKHALECVDCHDPHFGNAQYFLK